MGQKYGRHHITGGKTKSLVVLSVILILSTLLSGCYLLPKEEDNLTPPPLVDVPKVVYNTIDVAKGTLEKNIKGSAVFTSARQEDVFFKLRGGSLKNIYVAAGDMVKKGQLLADLDLGQLDSQIKLQEINLKMAKLNYEDMKANGAKEIALEKAKLTIEQEQIRLDDLKAQYEGSRLVAPFAGRVIYVDRTLSQGDNVTIKKTVVTIADPDNTNLVYRGDSVADVQVGMAVNINFYQKDYTGKVIMAPSSAPVDASQEMKSMVIIKPDTIPDGIRIGDRADITITLDKRENVIVLPKYVVKSFTGRNYVRILVDNLPVERDVELGLQAPTEVEIIKGLEVGDKVITN